MKRFLAVVSILLMLTACGVNNQPGEDMAGNDTQTSMEDSGGESSQTHEEEIEEPIPEFELNETFQKLLDEVNAAHSAVEMYDGDYSAYLGRIEDAEYEAGFVSAIPQSGQSVVTLQQVTDDMEWLYHTLRVEYGAYTHFGGDEAFRPAIDAVIADCAAMSTITVKDVLISLLRNFAFVKDAHFTFGGLSLAERVVPFFFRNTAYTKTEKGYETLDGKVVASVNGQSDLDELFKLSLTAEGDLVYYPVVLEPVSYIQLATGLEIRCSTYVLNVQYEDGTRENLHPDPYTLPQYDLEETEILVSNGVPMIHLKNFFGTYGGIEYTSFARDYRESDIKIVDLLKCPGGLPGMATSWFAEYTQREFWGNSLRINGGLPDPMYEKHLSMQEEKFVSSDTVLIVLTSKASASSSEWFIDLAHNLENTLFVGENSSGCYIGNLTERIFPNIGTHFAFGTQLILTPGEEYFQEYRGFYPDIWVPAVEAEEAVMNFIAKNTTVK